MSQVIGDVNQGTTGQQLANGPVLLLTGLGSPNSSVDKDVLRAAVGSVFLRRDGGTSTVLYIRETAATNGWVAK
ncbi:MAG: hypothetical protein LAN83_07305 [Acidobacteriia bacterium]|nr:hypothetical protein [Terriglobia bacterium]